MHRTRAAAILSVCLALLLPAFCLAVDSPDPSVSVQEQNTRLVKSVILCRHGLRTPLQSPRELALWSRKEWPGWKEKTGHLTARGAALLKVQGQKLRQQLAWEGLLPESGCPSPDAIFLYADNESRTEHSARALAEGLAPGCTLSFFRLPGRHGSDALFHPVRSGLMPPPRFSSEERRELLHRLETLRAELAPLTNELSALLGPVSPSLCLPEREDCQLSDVPTRVSFPDPRSRESLKLEGGMAIASAAAEILLLESLQWPVQAWDIAEVSQETSKSPQTSPSETLSPAGFKAMQIITAPSSDDPDVQSLPIHKERRLATPQNGDLVMANPGMALRLLNLHTAVQNTLQRQPAVARSEGLPLLTLMTGILEGTSPLNAANDASLVILIGHDTSIEHLAALLDLHWDTPPFPTDSTPPGAMLILNLWENPSGRMVQAAFSMLPPAAILNTSTEAMEQSGLVHQALRLPGADLSSPSGEALSLSRFTELVASLGGATLEEPLRRLFSAL